MPGPPKKPTNLLKLHGNPGKRPFPKNEPKPNETPPLCPESLSKAAKEEWKRLIKTLGRVGLTTKCDRSALILYCEAWAIWSDAVANIQAHGSVISDNGIPKLSPYIRVADIHFKQMLPMIKEFGMTPASRTRIQVNEPKNKEPDDLEKFLSKRGPKPGKRNA